MPPRTGWLGRGVHGAVALVLVVSMTWATAVQAAPHQVLVLRAEGTADAASRAAVDAHVLRLARNIPGNVEQGDITLSDAAAAAGCDPAVNACKDEILMTFAVDEIVTTTVTSGAGALNVTVRRFTRGKPPRAAASSVPSAKAFAKLDADLGPLFGTGYATAPLADPPTPPPAATTTTAATTAPMVPADPYADTSSRSMNDPMQDPMQGGAMPPAYAYDAPPPDRTLQKVGMGAGAALVVLSFVLWSQAASRQDEIDRAPVDTPTDFARLRELERDADGLAGAGNLMFIGGVVLGGISGYYYWKKGRQARTQTARIAPVVFPGGGGVVLSLGGRP
jgi:hypothetical protein